MPLISNRTGLRVRSSARTGSRRARTLVNIARMGPRQERLNQIARRQANRRRLGRRRPSLSRFMTRYIGMRRRMSARVAGYRSRGFFLPGR